MQRVAKCYCKSLSVTTTGDALVSLCNCLDCQRRTGSVFGVSAYFDKEQITSIQGEYKSFTRLGDSGLKIETNFCPTCGTSLFWTAELYQNKMGVALGCFEDPNFPAPVRAVYTKSKHHWVTLPPGIALYEESTVKRES